MIKLHRYTGISPQPTLDPRGRIKIQSPAFTSLKQKNIFITTFEVQTSTLRGHTDTGMTGIGDPPGPYFFKKGGI